MLEIRRQCMRNGNNINKEKLFENEVYITFGYRLMIDLTYRKWLHFKQYLRDVSL